MTYRAGIIGIGGVGAAHGSAYRGTDGIEVAAVADVDGDVLVETGERWGIPAERRYADHVAMLRSEDLDAVSIASPTYLHNEHVLDAVDTGAPDVIWCEKPIATSVNDAEAMVEACDDAGIDLVVNHARRWAEPYRALRERLDDGLLGDVRTVNAQFKLELLRNGTHFVDVIHWFLGERFERASGHVTGETPMHDRDLPIPVDDGGGGGHLVLEDGTFVTLDCVIPRSALSGWFVFTGPGGRPRSRSHRRAVRLRTRGK